MRQEIEIEYKNTITAPEFERLCQYFNIQKSHFFYHHNHYFDTPDFSLKKRGCALRIREKKSNFTLTLKQPHPDGLLETHQSLTEESAQLLRRGSLFPEGMIKQSLHQMKVPISLLVYLGTLSTKRAEHPYKKGLLVFDHSFYLETEDYELEYESTKREDGERVFNDLLASLNIPKRVTKNKIHRFFSRKTLYQG